MFKIFLILISFFTSFVTPKETTVHDFHMSSTEIRYKPDQNTIQISTRIFIDDLENAIALYDDSPLFLCSEKEIENASFFVEGYIKTNLKFSKNGKTLPMEFIGKELSEDMMSVWSYFEINNIPAFSEIQLENKLLIDLFDDQKNMTAFYLVKKNLLYEFLDIHKTNLTLSYQ